MRALVAITSCAKDVINGNNEALRSTWAKKMNYYEGFDYKFFIGTGTPRPLEDEHPQFQQSFNTIKTENPNLLKSTPLNHEDLIGDEVLLDIPDTYPYLPHKIRAIRKWAWLEGYDFLFKCDVDTFVIPKRLASSGFWLNDYVGYGSTFEGPERIKLGDTTNKYAWGGAGYWLSRYAFESTIDCEIDSIFEDVWTGLHLNLFEIRLHVDDRYCYDLSRPDELISVHLSKQTGMYSKDQMFQTSILLDKYKTIKPLVVVKRPSRTIRRSI